MDSNPASVHVVKDLEPGTHLEPKLRVLVSEIEGVDQMTAEVPSQFITLIKQNLNGPEAQSSKI